MTSQAKHTGLPISREEDSLPVSDMAYALFDANGVTIGHAHGAPRADEIVTAVNSHDALLAVYEAAEIAVAFWEGDYEGDLDAVMEPLREKFKAAALKLAGEV